VFPVFFAGGGGHTGLEPIAAWHRWQLGLQPNGCAAGDPDRLCSRAAGVVFTVGLFASTAAVALYHGLRIERPWTAYGVPAVLIVAVLCFGVVRLKLASGEPTERVGLAAIDDFIGSRNFAGKD